MPSFGSDLALNDIAARGVLLDGFPRTADQAAALEEMLQNLGQPLDAAINIDVPNEVVTARMLARGRADDTPEAIARRLALYEQQTAPLLDWFDTRGLLVSVDGAGTPDEVFAGVVDAVARVRGDTDG